MDELLDTFKEKFRPTASPPYNALRDDHVRHIVLNEVYRFLLQEAYNIDPESDTSGILTDEQWINRYVHSET